MEAVILDVSELPAPEPFHRILTALAQLREDQYLVAHHRKEPRLIYQTLQDMGYVCQVKKGAKHPFEIIIWRSTQPCPVSLCPPGG